MGPRGKRTSTAPAAPAVAPAAAVAAATRVRARDEGAHEGEDLFGRLEIREDDDDEGDDEGADDKQDEDEDDEDDPFAREVFVSGSDAETSDEDGPEDESERASDAPAAPEDKPAAVDDEDVSSDEDTVHSRNTVGRIPLEWYNDFPHIGYDLNGERILKPAKGDELEKFLDEMEDPEKWWRTIQDKTGRKVELTDEEIEMIERITMGKLPEGGYDPYEDYGDFFTRHKMIHPVTNTPEPKRRFVPSKWEAKKVMKLVRAIRAGRIVTRKAEAPTTRFYNIWDSAPGSQRNVPDVMVLPAPKMKLPNHHESYNPPAEFLWSKDKLDEWNRTDSQDRPPDKIVPRKFDCLRHVPSYNRFINERFERCLDLYLCPRVRKNRLNIDPEALIPPLPKPRDLQPFPTTLSMVYEGHTDKVRALSVDPTGRWLVTGSDDGSVRLWEIATTRCLRTWQMPAGVVRVAFSPTASVVLIAVLSGATATFLNPMCASQEITDATTALVKAAFEGAAQAGDGVLASLARWSLCPAKDAAEGRLFVIEHSKPLKDVCWHFKGDYFATVCPDANTQAVLVHQLSKRSTQNPFKKLKGHVQSVLFHPSKPIFFVATQRYVRVYNLLKQELVKKLQSGVKWISSMAVHPGGDNVIIGSYDKRLCWFDMDLSTRPYHTFAVRRVAFHPTLPLFASCSDDASVHIFHGMVYADLLQNPLIVPVKVLRGHGITDHLGVLDCQFHPHQPWIFTCGADATVRLFV